MKLAEALAERSDCQNRLEELKKRVLRSARVQEGEKPAEDADELLAEIDRVFARLLELVTAINRTNAKTAFDARPFWQKERYADGPRGSGQHSAGSLFEIRGEICGNGVDCAVAEADRLVVKAIQGGGHAAPGTELEHGTGLRQLVADFVEASTSPARG
jgi:hypothetical protein